jgi:XTP/dITP diphosphohydrolase
VKAVFASRNRNKSEQVALLLPEIDLVPLDEVAPDLELEEPFHTFEENALAKARAVVAATGLPATADDSGLEVDALGGAPGVRSARYAGEMATDKENNTKLLEALHEVPEEERTCRYRCAAVFVGTDGRSIVADGACEGRVITEPRGNMGFGYADLQPSRARVPLLARPLARGRVDLTLPSLLTLLLGLLTCCFLSYLVEDRGIQERRHISQISLFRHVPQ